jgi:hypothetical protein
MGGVQGIAAALRTDPKNGLFGDELEEGKDGTTIRIEHYGTNMYEQVTHGHYHQLYHLRPSFASSLISSVLLLL